MLTPSQLPDVRTAKLPRTYAAAQQALTKCSSIDECKTWRDQTEALKSYAKQAHDEGLRKMAERIQARAIRRCGELMRAIEAKAHGRESRGVASPHTSRSQRAAAATAAGLTKSQKHEALRIAAIPEAEFEQLIESDDPPSRAALAERGKQSRRAWEAELLNGRAPADFRAATATLGALTSFVSAVAGLDLPAACRGLTSQERTHALAQIKKAETFLTRLRQELER